MRTRKAILPDAEHIHDLICAYSGDGTLLPRTLPEICENVRDFVVLEDDGRIIGCGALHLYGTHLAEIRSITVAPWAQGRGGGSKLVKALMSEAKRLGAPYEIVRMMARGGLLPVPNFAAGGIATPADAALCMQLGAESVFVGSGIFKSSDPAVRARAIVKATTHYNDPKAVLEASEELGEAMRGLDVAKIAPGDLLQTRGW